MTTNTTALCGICEARTITKYAEHWCPECGEGLCSECIDQHSFSKISKNHETISIQNYLKLPGFVTDTIDDCEIHGLKCTNYCQDHDTVCCPACLISDHQKCVELRLLADLIPNSKTSALVDLLENKFDEMVAFIDKGLEDRNQNLTDLIEEKHNLIDEIEIVRGKINSHLDNLEQTIRKELNDKYEETKSMIQTNIAQLSEKSNEIKELKDNLSTIKEYGSDLQAFFGTRKIEEKANEEDTFLKSTSENNFFHNMKIIGEIDKNVTDILSDLTTFGMVSIESDLPTVVYRTREEKEAQSMTSIHQVTPESVYDISLKLLSIINIQRGKTKTSLWGCTIHSDGKMIFTDRKNCRLLIFNMDSSFDKEIVIKNATTAFDVTIVRGQTVVVSTNNGIKIVDVNSGQMTREIQSGGDCCGITYCDDSLLWCEKSHGIKKMELKEENVCTILLQSKFPSFSFLETVNENIYLTNYKEKTVVCYTKDGIQKWSFKDDTILDDPTCIAVDNNNFVYVTSTKSHNVVVISPDGQQGRVLLSSDDGIYIPRGICLDRMRNNLLIANADGITFLYHLHINNT